MYNAATQITRMAAQSRNDCHQGMAFMDAATSGGKERSTTAPEGSVVPRVRKIQIRNKASAKSTMARFRNGDRKPTTEVFRAARTGSDTTPSRNVSSANQRCD